MTKRVLLALLLALTMCLSPVSALAADETGTELGDVLEDFSFTTYDGQEHTLSETLREKDMVLINLWATWCGPCEMEFPYMEEAYEQYQDRIEIFALSVEPEDDDEVLADYVEEHGMTFPVGRDAAGLGDIFVTEGIPTSLVVDRFGVICAMEVGSQTDASCFTKLFDTYVGEDYAESILLDGFPEPEPETPTVEPTDEAELARALLGEDAYAVTVKNPEDPYNWPVQAVKLVDVSCVATSNAGVDSSTSAVELAVTAQEGDALDLSYKVSCESYYDCMTISVDGEVVKTASGKQGWTYFATALEPGEHTVTLAFAKDEMEGGGEDMAWFDEVHLLSGEDAEAALAKMPVYPHSDASDLTLTTEGAKEIVITPDLGIEGLKAYIVGGEEAELKIDLAEGVDPDAAGVYTDYTGDVTLLTDCLDGDGYTYTTGIDTLDASGYSYTMVTLYLPEDDEGVNVLLIADEANANAFLRENELESWAYADGSEPATDEAAQAPEAPAGDVEYTLSFIDQDDAPVEGVIANVCDDTACTPMTSDADGLVQFTYPPFAYHIQVIKVPDGYEYDTSQEAYLSEDGGSVVFVLTKK